jgi:hypothetical protein
MVSLAAQLSHLTGVTSLRFLRNYGLLFNEGSRPSTLLKHLSCFVTSVVTRCRETSVICTGRPLVPWQFWQQWLRITCGADWWLEPAVRPQLQLNTDEGLIDQLHWFGTVVLLGADRAMPGLWLIELTKQHCLLSLPHCFVSCNNTCWIPLAATLCHSSSKGSIGTPCKATVTPACYKQPLQTLTKPWSYSSKQ